MRTGYKSACGVSCCEVSEIESALRKTARYAIRDAREALRKFRRKVASGHVGTDRDVSAHFHSDWIAASLGALHDTAETLELDRLARILDAHNTRFDRQFRALFAREWELILPKLYPSLRRKSS
jgi:hypothetical protein